MTALIGILYAASGAGGMIYRNGDPFMATFLVEGLAVLALSIGLARLPAGTAERHGGHAGATSSMRQTGPV